MHKIRRFAFVLLVSQFVLFIACKKENQSQKTVPELTTAPVTAVSSTSAISGGTITRDGGESIAFSGICWSTTPNPTILNDTTKGTTATGSFTASLKNLIPSTKYYVRAYATNRIGTGYGQVIELLSGNGAPVATSVSVAGIANGDELLTGNYVYSDVENDLESGTTFQWYVASDGAGTGETAIAGATSKTYRVQASQQGKYIRFGVAPKAATGSQNGTEVKSSFIGAIGEATTITFVYNGVERTYGILTTATGRKWLDRNLGASRVAQSVDDYLAYGDLFQWGRLADGHHRVSRTDGTAAGTSGDAGITSVLSNIDAPTTNAFIITSGGDNDWRSPQNNNLWQGVSGINNPCPAGWRIATEAEWAAEAIVSPTDAFNKLKLTLSGYRAFTDAAFGLNGSQGRYWSSTVRDTDPTLAVQIRIRASDGFTAITNNRAYGSACRCIKD